jgi:hypothetical protein
MGNTFFDEISNNYKWITLTGISGLGKSYWSKVFAAKGYKREKLYKKYAHHSIPYNAHRT